jgi:hypothetical protein
MNSLRLVSSYVAVLCVALIFFGVFHLIALLVMVWFLVTTGQAIDVLRKETRDRHRGRRVCVLRACTVGNLCGDVDEVPAYIHNEGGAARSELVTKSDRVKTPVCCGRCRL